ncbi:MAG: hypothetical protein EXS03_09180 [Phycisphaerales bacterium]|nr:hypothetical protein [Phycisphaerales bacterium]
MKLNFDIKSLLKRKPKGDSQRHDAGSESSRSASSESLTRAAIWIKAHILLVGMGVVSVGAVTAGIILSGEMLAAVKEEAKGYGSKLNEFRGLESTSVTITVPGKAPVTASTVVNRKLLAAVKARMGSGANDSAQVRANAVAHNQGVHTPLVNLRLPAKDPKRQEIHLDLVAKLAMAYEDLLVNKLGAGLPPAEEDITLKLQRRHVRFVQSDLKKAPDAALTDVERRQLTDQLAAYRVALYAEAADGIRIYASGEDVGTFKEGFDPSSLKLGIAKLWNLQSRYWIVEDILLACRALNTEPSVTKNPVKRVLSIRSLGAVAGVVVAGEPSAPTSGGGDDGASTDAGSSDGGSDGSPTTTAATTDGAGGDGMPIDPTQLVSTSNYASSLKGWATNQLYDVSRAVVELVIETEQIPRVADALAKQNFIAITTIEILPTDAFAGLADGFFYGDRPVSIVTLTLESAWLREWTGPLMPDEVRAQLKTTGQLAGITPGGGAAPSQEN